jgi:uncharacterized protein (DUF952 family)
MIYHIANEADWENCLKLDTYAPKRFAVEKFIHCSTYEQVERVCNARFANQAKVWLLTIDRAKENKHTIYENLEGGKELFPHIYRELPKTSIVKAVLVEKNEEDVFKLPL